MSPRLFWLRSDIDPLERKALDLCRGRVLDVGAIDVAEEYVEIMRDRGVARAFHADLYDFDGGPFDTVLCIGNGLDKVGPLTKLLGFLRRMRAPLAPGGQLLADSFDVRVGPDEIRTAALAPKTAAGRYFGEIDLRFEYRGSAGESFTALQVDYEMLACTSSREGWISHRIAKDRGHYLARLVPVKG